jgi:hypothetical protein
MGILRLSAVAGLAVVGSLALRRAAPGLGQSRRLSLHEL